MVELLGYAHAVGVEPGRSTRRCRSKASRERCKRRKGTPARGNLHAKTGTTNTVPSLGGFVTARNGEVLAFSFIYNGSDRWNAKAAMDRWARRWRSSSERIDTSPERSEWVGLD